MRRAAACCLFSSFSLARLRRCRQRQLRRWPGPLARWFAPPTYRVCCVFRVHFCLQHATLNAAPRRQTRHPRGRHHANGAACALSTQNNAAHSMGKRVGNGRRGMARGWRARRVSCKRDTVLISHLVYRACHHLPPRCMNTHHHDATHRYDWISNSLYGHEPSLPQFVVGNNYRRRRTYRLRVQPHLYSLLKRKHVYGEPGGRVCVANVRYA